MSCSECKPVSARSVIVPWYPPVIGWLHICGRKPEKELSQAGVQELEHGATWESLWKAVE